MSEEEIIRICKLICGTKKKNGKREYKTIQRMNLLRDYTEDKLEEAIEGLLDLYNKQKEEIKELKLITNGYNSYLGENMGGYKIIIADSKYFLNGTFVEKYISKTKIKEILDLAYKDNYEMVKLPNNDFMCVSDCENLLDYLKELVEENESIE